MDFVRIGFMFEHVLFVKHTRITVMNKSVLSTVCDIELLLCFVERSIYLRFPLVEQFWRFPSPTHTKNPWNWAKLLLNSRIYDPLLVFKQFYYSYIKLI